LFFRGPEYLEALDNLDNLDILDNLEALEELDYFVINLSWTDFMPGQEILTATGPAERVERRIPSMKPDLSGLLLISLVKSRSV